MTRTLSATEAVVLERLELERPELVTMSDLTSMLGELRIGTTPRVFAARLREKGWLLPTGQRGVWEFAPAALAGPYSSADPLLTLRSWLVRRPAAQWGLTFQAAAWAHGLADRIPVRPEVAVHDAVVARKLPTGVDASVFVPALSCVELRGVPVLAVESVIVHACAKPSAVRSWTSLAEWLPDLALEADVVRVCQELSGRPLTVATRTGYLLQGLRPDIASAIADEWSPRTKTWFGPRGTAVRRDNRWWIADTLLPFDPRRWENVV